MVALLLQGKSNKQIALMLDISERTVEFHLKNIYARMQVNSRVELILKLGKSTGDFDDNQVESTVDISNNYGHNGKQTDTHNNWAQFLKKIVPMNEKEFAMINKIRIILGAVTTLFGMVLIVGGIITDKNGAVVVGICVSAIAIQQLIVSIKQAKKSDT